VSTSSIDPVLFHVRQAAALYLWRLEAVRVNTAEPFRLASGNWSPIYVNCRRAISEPAFMQLFTVAARLVLETAGRVPQAVAGGETAGIPFASYLAASWGLPLVYVRKKPKDYGISSRVEGRLEPGTRVVLVEDLITDGGSKLGFLDALAEAGAEVRDAVVLFDREQGGREVLAERGVALHAVTDRTTALAAGEAAGLLGRAERAAVEAYFDDPEAWQRGLG
jgi:orotate phosphoribosyltransferase